MSIPLRDPALSNSSVSFSEEAHLPPNRSVESASGYLFVRRSTAWECASYATGTLCAEARVDSRVDNAKAITMAPRQTLPGSISTGK